MNRFLQFALAAILLAPLPVLGSGQIIVQPGETVEVKAETAMGSPEFTWTIMKGDALLETIKQQTLSYAFPQPGNYVASLTITNEAGTEERSSVDILVGKSPNELLPLGAVFRSLPPVNENNIAYINPQKPQAILYAAESKGKIVEYRIDRNITVDSNGDGDPANDIDNKSDTSFQSGVPWGIVFSQVGNTTARLTVVDGEGKSDSKDITFQPDDRMLKNEKLTASISSVPSFNDAGELHLTGDTSEAVFYFGESKGDITQYRFDRDIAVDSDGDGDPANDIDNKNHPSFLSGEPLQVTLRKPSGYDQIAQLIVVSADGKGSRIRKKIVFETPKTNLIPSVAPVLKPKLFLDYRRAVTGTPVNFYVLGAPQGARYSWDFEDDGTIDASGNSADAQFVYENPGEYTPKVTVVFKDVTATASDAITIIEPPGNTDTGEFSAPTADFTYTVEQGVARFSNASSADPRLSSQDLQYEWNFGDGGEASTEKDPEHTYAAAGTFSVILKVTDANGVESKKTVEIAVLAAGEASPTAEPSASADASGSPTASEAASPGQGEATPVSSTAPGTETDGGTIGVIGKLLLFLITPLLLLAIGYFSFRKVQNPDMRLKEIVDEELSRLTKTKKIMIPEQRTTVFTASSESDISALSTHQGSTQDEVSSRQEANIEDATIVETPSQSARTPSATLPESLDMGLRSGPVPEWIRLATTEDKPSVFSEANQQKEKAEEASLPVSNGSKNEGIGQEVLTADANAIKPTEVVREPSLPNPLPVSNINNTLPDWLRGDIKATPGIDDSSSTKGTQPSKDMPAPTPSPVVPAAELSSAPASENLVRQQPRQSAQNNISPTTPPPTAPSPPRPSDRVQAPQPTSGVSQPSRSAQPGVSSAPAPQAGFQRGQAVRETTQKEPSSAKEHQPSVSPQMNSEGTLFEHDQKSGTTGQHVFGKPEDGEKPS